MARARTGFFLALVMAAQAAGPPIPGRRHSLAGPPAACRTLLDPIQGNACGLSRRIYPGNKLKLLLPVT